MKRQNHRVWPPVNFSITDDDDYVRDLKVLIHQMMQQEAKDRLTMKAVCDEIMKINGNLFCHTHIYNSEITIILASKAMAVAHFCIKFLFRVLILKCFF